VPKRRNINIVARGREPKQVDQPATDVSVMFTWLQETDKPFIVYEAVGRNYIYRPCEQFAVIRE
jgi:hypothetical protein